MSTPSLIWRFDLERARRVRRIGAAWNRSWRYHRAVSSSPPFSSLAPAELVERINQAFCEMVPHNRALAMRVLDIADGAVRALLPWDARLVGNPELGILHGGAVTSLIDATCGVAVFARLMSPMPIATLDLRIDYLRPAEPSRDVVARAECYKLTRNVAFVRAIAYHDDPAEPIASAAGTFMVSTPGSTVMEKPRRGDGG
jgi:uncharacterized protein (TIGR00369 family)